MIGPVHWGSYTGEYLEKAMAALVSAEHHGAIRRRPASGDGGIDVLIPDGDGYEVRQIKKFTQSLTPGQKSQIERSYREARDRPRLDKPITAYRLVVPLDPTPGEQSWFEELVDDAPWPVEWRGEVHWDEMASRFPQVTDYFFRGDTTRIVERSKELQVLARSPEQPFTPEYVATQLCILQQGLNRDDPFYRYDLRTSAQLPVTSEPNTVLEATSQLTDGSFLTIGVIPKYRYAVEDCPITGTISIAISDPDVVASFKEEFDAFETYGRTLHLPKGSTDLTLNAPGGLGGETLGGGGMIGPAKSPSQFPSCRLVALDDAGDVVAELPLHVSTHTAGTKGGAEVGLDDETGVVHGVLQLHPRGAQDDAPLAFSLVTTGIAGEVVQRILPALRFLHACHPPNRIQLRPEFGATVFATFRLDDEHGGPDEATYRHLENLAFLQDLATQPLVVPETFEGRVAKEIDRYVRMLKGQTVSGTWGEITFTLHERRTQWADTHGGEHPLLLRGDCRVEIGGEEVELGTFITTLATARLADNQPEDEQRARFVPGDDATYRSWSESLHPVQT